MRIVFTGSHGTGKSTLAKEFSNRLEEVARKLIGEMGHPNDMSEEQLDAFELEIFKRQVAEESRMQDFVSDRCVIDVLAYATTFASSAVIMQLKDSVQEYINTSPYDLVFYTPIEFPMESDGIRFENETYREIIDLLIVKYLKLYNIKYVTLTGTIEDRLCTIKSFIGNIQQSNLPTISCPRVLDDPIVVTT